jgi:hypothetical protein
VPIPAPETCAAASGVWCREDRVRNEGGLILVSSTRTRGRAGVIALSIENVLYENPDGLTGSERWIGPADLLGLYRHRPSWRSRSHFGRLIPSLQWLPMLYKREHNERRNYEHIESDDKQVAKNRVLATAHDIPGNSNVNSGGRSPCDVTPRPQSVMVGMRRIEGNPPKG